MKKLIISVVLSTPLFLTAMPVSSAPSVLENPAQRTDASAVNNKLSKTTNYAYWYRWHRWNHWNRWNHWHRWHRWHRWHYY